MRVAARVFIGEKMPRKRSEGRVMGVKKAIDNYELTQNQLEAIQLIRDNKIIVLRGRAGTSKTFVAVYAALELLAEKQIGRIALTRPLVTTEKMGFLPGAIDEKFDPFLYPIIDFFNKFGDNGAATFNFMAESGKIRKAPIAFMRGSTIENEILIADEGQNFTAEQMLMLLTRIGKNGKIVITGDEAQSDLPEKAVNGLSYVIKLAEKLPYVKQYTFIQNMRDPMINEIIEAWEEIKRDG
jgi:phosphate starvation-inducible PhoH-like protein